MYVIMKTLGIRFLQFDKNDVNLMTNSKMNYEIFGFLLESKHR